jgi:hypothetical protein
MANSDRNASVTGHCRKWLRLFILLGIGTLSLTGLIERFNLAMAQNTDAEITAEMLEPIAFVATAGEDPGVREVSSFSRFSDVVGSGALMVNAENAVVGYYFTVIGLEPEDSYAYHFHSALNDGVVTSCEGDKALLETEAAGAVIANLGELAPLEVTESGLARVGSPGEPIALSEPIPLAEIGYLNIHPVLQGEVEPGIVCANVRLNPGGFVR